MASFNAGHNKPELSRSHADLRLKMGQKNEELASIPSEITEDERAEILNFRMLPFRGSTRSSTTKLSVRRRPPTCRNAAW